MGVNVKVHLFQFDLKIRQQQSKVQMLVQTLMKEKNFYSHAWDEERNSGDASREIPFPRNILQLAKPLLRDLKLGGSEAFPELENNQFCRINSWTKYNFFATFTPQSHNMYNCTHLEREKVLQNQQMEMHWAEKVVHHVAAYGFASAALCATVCHIM